MVEPKPIASLTGGLLARKGDARPAMRHAHLPMSSAVRRLPEDSRDQNAPSPAHRQLRQIERSFGTKAQAKVRSTKAAFTLRLDPDRHLRLRLASAVGNRSAQQIVTEALDNFLNQQPCLDELVAKARG